MILSKIIRCSRLWHPLYKVFFFNLIFVFLFFNTLAPVLTGGTVHRLAYVRYRGHDAVQHPVHTALGHRTVHGFVHRVHGPILRAAHDGHHGAVRTDRTPSQAHRPAEAHHHGPVVERPKENLVTRVQGQLVVQSAQNAR